MCVCGRFSTHWENTLSTRLSLGRVQVGVTSADTLHANVTSALIDLLRLVRNNWTADYYAPQVTHITYECFRYRTYLELSWVERPSDGITPRHKF